MMFGMIFFTSTVGEIFALTLLAPVWSRNVTWMPSPSAIPFSCGLYPLDCPPILALRGPADQRKSLPLQSGPAVPLQPEVHSGSFRFDFHDIEGRHARLAERPRRQRRSPLHHMHDVRPHDRAARAALPLAKRGERHRL